MSLYIIGENIPSGTEVVESTFDGRLYADGDRRDGVFVGRAVEDLREGFRAHVRAGEVREDDA